MSTPNPPEGGTGPSGGAEQPGHEQSPWGQPQQPQQQPYGQPPVAPPPPPVDPYGQQQSQQQQQPYGQPPVAPPPPPAAGPYGQPQAPQQPWAPDPAAGTVGGYPAANPYATVAVNSGAYASWGQRAAALLLDSLLTLPVIVVGSILIGIGAGGSTKITYDAQGYATTTTNGGYVALAAIGYILYIVGGLVINGYNRWYKGGKTGQSWGRKMMGIKLVRESDGQPVGVGMAFVRDLLHSVINNACLIDYLWPLWDAKRQTLTDKILTHVVYPGVPKK